MKITLIILGILAFQFALAVFLGKCIRAGRMPRRRDGDRSAPRIRGTTPNFLTSK